MLPTRLFVRKTECKKKFVGWKKNRLSKTEEPHYFRTSSFCISKMKEPHYFCTYSFRISKTKEPNYFLTFSFRISKSIFEGVFREDFFCQRVFGRYFSSYLFSRGTFKEFFPEAFLPKILCSKVFLKRSYFFARSFFIDIFPK